MTNYRIFTKSLFYFSVLSSCLLSISTAHAALEKKRNDPRPPACTPGVRSSYIFANENSCLEVSGSIFAMANYGYPIVGPLARLSQFMPDPAFYSSGRADLELQAHTKTDLGVFSSDVLLRSNWNNTVAITPTFLRYASISLDTTDEDKFTLGYVDSFFYSWISYGGLFNNDVIFALAGTTPAVRYQKTYKDGLSYAVALEQPTNNSIPGHTLPFYAITSLSDGNSKVTDLDWHKKHTLPNLVVALSSKNDAFEVSNVTSLNPQSLNLATRLRLGFKVNDATTLWVQGGYKTREDSYIFVDNAGNPMNPKKKKGTEDKPLYLQRLKYDAYGAWGGHFYGYAGVSHVVNPKLTLHAQAGMDQTKTFIAGINGTYNLTKNLILLSEVNYVAWKDDTTADSSKYGVTKVYGNDTSSLGALVQLKMLF